MPSIRIIEILHFHPVVSIDRVPRICRRLPMAQLEYDTKSITDAVIARMAECQDARFKEVMTSLVRHLHAFARDVDLKGDEWFSAIEFLTACGKACDEKRQEFILLSDTLGLSMLVVALEHGRALAGRTGATQPTDAGARPF